MSDRIGQLTARLQARSIDFRAVGGAGKGELQALDIAAAFGCIKGAANQAIASYYYSVGNDRHGAVDALYLILAREWERQVNTHVKLASRGASNDTLLRRAANNWPTSARKNGVEYSLDDRIRDIARIVIDEKNGRIKTHACVAKYIGVHPTAMTNTWHKVLSYARTEVANALACAENDIIETLR